MDVDSANTMKHAKQQKYTCKGAHESAKLARKVVIAVADKTWCSGYLQEGCWGREQACFVRLFPSHSDPFYTFRTCRFSNQRLLWRIRGHDSPSCMGENLYADMASDC